MVKKGVRFSEKHKEKIRQALLARKAKLGYVNSEETRNKMRLAKLGKPSNNKGKKCSSESIERMRVAHKGQVAWNKGRTDLPSPSQETIRKRKLKMMGKDNPAWRGGVTPENHKIRTSIEMRLWRESVFARDNYTCQKTGKRGGKLHPHHIKNFADYPELRFAIDNGITFSDKSHREFHKEYGIKNNTKEQLEEFLLAVIKG